MSSTFYCQCRLIKLIDKGQLELVSYIPEKYAVVDRILKLKSEDGTWEDGWRVHHVGARVEERLLPDPHDDIKAHRRATGDALPKRG
jgi:hypothetical protein